MNYINCKNCSPVNVNAKLINVSSVITKRKSGQFLIGKKRGTVDFAYKGNSSRQK